MKFKQVEGGQQPGAAFDLPGKCDICGLVAEKEGDVLYDAKTVIGPWAYMCPECFSRFAIGLGTGRGQRYELID